MDTQLYDKIAALDVKSLLGGDPRHEVAQVAGAGAGAYLSAGTLGKFGPQIADWISKAPLGTRTRAIRAALAAVGTAGVIGGTAAGGAIAGGRAVPERSLWERLKG